MTLSRLRKNIDTLDSKILQLINRRAQNAGKIAHLKRKGNMKTYSAEREAQILRRLRLLNKGPLKNTDVEFIFREVLSICRGLKVTLDIAFLGPRGTFTHMASINKFGKHCHFISCDSIREVFERVEREGVDYGIVPVENSIEGVVNYTLDMFFESNLKICDEIIMNISHSLLRSSVRKKLVRIYSNPHVFPQCRQWLQREYPKVQLVPTSTTAKAAEMAKKDPHGACMGSRMLGVLYGLKEVRSHIEDSLSNATRFLVISGHDSLSSGRDKTSILFAVKDKVGALYDALHVFKKYRINLTKIESRPSKRKPWEYYFFVDIEGHRDKKNVREALKSLEAKCAFIKTLGSYPKEH